MSVSNLRRDHLRRETSIGVIVYHHGKWSWRSNPPRSVLHVGIAASSLVTFVTQRGDVGDPVKKKDVRPLLVIDCP